MYHRNTALAAPAEAAERIAARCPGMDREKAYVCGLLHDIDRREGVFALRHLFW